MSSQVKRRATRTLPRERADELAFTYADRVKLNSIEFGATATHPPTPGG